MYDGSIQITLTVVDVPRSVAFYRDVLGFDFVGYWDPATHDVVKEWRAEVQPEYAEVRAGDARVGLVPGTPPIRGGSPAGGVRLSLNVADIGALVRQLRGAGIDVPDPELQPWGALQVLVEDPDGYPWAVLQAVRFDR